MKKKSMMLPFTVDEKFNTNYMKGSGLENIVSVNSLSMLRNMIQKISSKKNNKEKYPFIKASESKKLGGGFEQVLFPAGLSGATAVLGLAALQHAVKQKSSSKKKKASKK